jgi:hypothetical protein
MSKGYFKRRKRKRVFFAAVALAMVASLIFVVAWPATLSAASFQSGLISDYLSSVTATNFASLYNIELERNAACARAGFSFLGGGAAVYENSLILIKSLEG